MEDTLLFILKKLSSKPKEVSVSKSEENDHIIFSLELDEEDKGKIIGRQGRNIKSIRQILSVIAKRNNKTVSLNVE